MMFSKAIFGLALVATSVMADDTWFVNWDWPHKCDYGKFPEGVGSIAYDNKEECCRAKFNWEYNTCMKRYPTEADVGDDKDDGKDTEDQIMVMREGFNKRSAGKSPWKKYNRPVRVKSGFAVKGRKVLRMQGGGAIRTGPFDVSDRGEIMAAFEYHLTSKKDRQYLVVTVRRANGDVLKRRKLSKAKWNKGKITLDVPKNEDEVYVDFFAKGIRKSFTVLMDNLVVKVM